MFESSLARALTAEDRLTAEKHKMWEQIQAAGSLCNGRLARRPYKGTSLVRQKSDAAVRRFARLVLDALATGRKGGECGG